MFTNEYKKYIKAKYKNIQNLDLQSYFIIDAIEALIKKTNISNYILKGGASLYFGYGYTRDGKLTNDIDISIRENLLTFKNKVIKIIDNNDNNTIYAFRVTKETPLSITTAGYEGIRLNILTKLKDNDSLYFNFHIDISIEEIGMNGIVKHEENLFIYSIERTIADKFVSMIQRGETNSRERDFIDFKNLFMKCDKNLLFTLIINLLNKRKVTQAMFTIFLKEFKNYRFIERHNIANDIEKLSIDIFNNWMQF